MIHIYLCEDDKRQLENWKNIIRKYILMHSTESRLYCSASNPDKLLSKRRASDTIGLYFLDIDLQSKKNGIELAQEIRRYDPRGYIVFVTTHSEMAVLTFRYKVEAMDFIIKDEVETLPKQICDCIQNAENNYRTQLHTANHLLSVKFEKSSLVLDQDDIVAITTAEEAHKIIIHTETGIRQITGSLKEMNAILCSTFLKCNRSAIVNLKHVRKYSREEGLIMDNKDTFPVSTRMMGKVKKSIQ
jgi:two-component system response regulator AgrA